MTSCDSDYQLALSLQQQFMEDDFNTNASSSTASSSKQGPTNIVDPQWELIDPNPNVFALFQEFNKQFFWKRLDMVEVRWSPRMTLCAGICSYQGHGGLCSIGLSQPLLKLRPRKDLVETLLHEMIHAYLFVTANNRDRDGHGPEFCKHMNRINAEAGTKITIYHSFHDEVNELRQHWWRCRGVCRNRPPYFGFVKRSMNRAPSKNDTWWAQHQQTCGGEYDKIKEPENYGKNKSKAKTNKENKIDPNQSVLNFKSVKSPSLNTPSTSALKTPTVENIKKKSPKKIQNVENKFPNSSNHILGGAKLKENPRGIPLNSRLVKLFQKPSPKKTLNTSQTGKICLTVQLVELGAYAGT
nr:sprT-like domain-containing protein Spartan [Ciona intestinalis]|eukprot:XP_002125958.1 sprT-like domain-containing protein Spartan [Ciona intestinalis]